MNKVILLGRLGHDPELRDAGNGNICLFSLATDESYTDRNGTRQERTEWHQIVAFGRTADNCSKFLRKGSSVLVEGKIQTRKWTDKEGVERHSTEINAMNVTFLDRPASSSQPRSQAAVNTSAYEEMDDIPF